MTTAFAKRSAVEGGRSVFLLYQQPTRVLEGFTLPCLTGDQLAAFICSDLVFSPVRVTPGGSRSRTMASNLSAGSEVTSQSRKRKGNADVAEHLAAAAAAAAAAAQGGTSLSSRAAIQEYDTRWSLAMQPGAADMLKLLSTWCKVHIYSPEQISSQATTLLDHAGVSSCSFVTTQDMLHVLGAEDGHEAMLAVVMCPAGKPLRNSTGQLVMESCTIMVGEGGQLVPLDLVPRVCALLHKEVVGTNSKHWGPTKDLARVTTVGGGHQAAAARGQRVHAAAAAV
ncbi:MAG: hypothetical protein WDW38_009014 [Sanguina aurantia]